VLVTAEREGWRRIVDPDGAQVWVPIAAISQARTVMITARAEGGAPLMLRPGRDSRMVASLLPGVTGRLGQCRSGWCKVTLSHGGRELEGWIARAYLWGVDGDSAPPASPQAVPSVSASAARQG
jgi:SH3-like domain-containing protein